MEEITTPVDRDLCIVAVTDLLGALLAHNEPDPHFGRRALAMSNRIAAMLEDVRLDCG